MGGETFSTRSSGSTPKEAFDKAVTEAQYEHGHGGYSGTIAEKSEHTKINLSETPEDKTRAQWAALEAERLLGEGDPRVDDKWGPAGCFHIEGDEYLFFGWASS